MALQVSPGVPSGRTGFSIWLFTKLARGKRFDNDLDQDSEFSSVFLSGRREVRDLFFQFTPLPRTAGAEKGLGEKDQSHERKGEGKVWPAGGWQFLIGEI